MDEACDPVGRLPSASVAMVRSRGRNVRATVDLAGWATRLRQPRGADLQSAVSQVCNLQAVPPIQPGFGSSHGLPNPIRRLARSLPLARPDGPLASGQIHFVAAPATKFSRLIICATHECCPPSPRPVHRTVLFAIGRGSQPASLYVNKLACWQAN